MPRKAKDKKNELNIEKRSKNTVSKKVAKSKTSNTVDSTKSAKRSTSKTSTNKKAISTKSITTKSNKSKSSAPKKSNKSDIKSNIVKNITTSVEYYDLPFRYNETVVKILAQTPNTLFIYWDISDKDRNSYTEKYGEDFFANTKPYLLITNETMNYTFEVQINDFANSWYLHINDANCNYKVELGRKFISGSPVSDNTSDSSLNLTFYHINDYISITNSNIIESPNDHILFDKLGNSVFFRNIKTNIVEEKNVSSLSFLQKVGTICNIYDFYKQIYNEELVSDDFELNLPSSNSSSCK